VVSPHSGILQGSDGDVVVVRSSTVCFGACRRCHSGLAGGIQARLTVVPWWLGWRHPTASYVAAWTDDSPMQSEK
jgi:hypothetical protein